MKIANSIALVTGANRGIGRELVKALLANGTRKVYATARDAKALESLKSLSPKVVPLRLDVTDARQISEAALAARDANLLINNAGVLTLGSILDVEQSDVERQFATNFFGKLNMARAFAPVIEASGGGAIVNILTLVALASMPGLSTYNASKAAAWSMTQSLRAALAPRRIEVFGVFPGAVETDMTAGMEIAKTSPADVAAAVLLGIQSGQEDIFPDPMSAQLYAAWKSDHKAVERQFALMG